MNRTYIIAEIGPNHNGNLKTAISLVKKLSAIGVNAVKFQISIPENAYSLDSFKPNYQKDDLNLSPIEMSKKNQLSFNDHLKLRDICKENKVDYLCTAFELESLEFLTNNMEMPYYKVPSGEILTIDLLDHISKQNKPVILSTGMATYEEINMSLSMLKNNKVTILHCISNYPTPPEDVNLRVMLELKSRFNCPIGFSDHTIGNDASVAAVAMGAEIIEKHVTYDKNAIGPDHKASATIDEFECLINSIRNIEKMMGETEKKFSKEEIEIRKSVRKSIVSTKILKAGHVITEDDICFKRPGFGYSPTEKEKIIKKILKSELGENRVILKEHLK